MPLYSHRCINCYSKQAIFKKIEDRDAPRSCGICGFSMERILDAPFVAPDFAPYDCPITGKIIEGRQAHIENLKRHGCRIREAGETESFRKETAAAETAAEEAVAETAAGIVANWDSRKQEQLATELSHGADINFDRKSA